MKHTVNDKYNYNKQQKTAFSYGYRFGVEAYRSYPKANAAKRKEILADIDYSKQNAAKGKQYDKGFMCAIRDCANERKGKK
jgi:hypothetical protein